MHQYTDPVTVIYCISEEPVPIHKSEHPCTCICVLEVSILPLFLQFNLFGF